ncbi:MAG: response regulator, partial [Spirochaetales bacterium]|nr:response regulator [Spirochaetales bacterium]
EVFDAFLKVSGSDMDLEAVEELEEIEEEVSAAASPVKGRVLVAEDHQVNQMLFKTILEHEGYTVEVASNGKEALEAVKQDSYQVIFMDVQMPEMNGYEASTAIRNLGIKTPIIAVTASAIKGEREKCFEVGMNDFLTKPFKKQDILPVLDRWTGEKGEAPVDEIAELESIPEDMVVFDYDEAVNTFMGNEGVVKKVLASYLDKVENQLVLLRQALEKKDLETLRMEAHSIKGSGYNLQAQEIGKKAEKLEHAARDGDLESCPEFIHEVDQAFQRLKKIAAGRLKD